MQRVARQYLVPEKLVMLVVGDLPAIEKGDPAHPVSLKDLAGGHVVDLPARDPLTLKPLPTQR